MVLVTRPAEFQVEVLAEKLNLTEFPTNGARYIVGDPADAIDEELPPGGNTVAKGTAKSKPSVKPVDSSEQSPNVTFKLSTAVEKPNLSKESEKKPVSKVIAPEKPKTAMNPFEKSVVKTPEKPAAPPVTQALAQVSKLPSETQKYPVRKLPAAEGQNPNPTSKSEPSKSAQTAHSAQPLAQLNKVPPLNGPAKKHATSEAKMANPTSKSGSSKTAANATKSVQPAKSVPEAPGAAVKPVHTTSIDAFKELLKTKTLPQVQKPIAPAAKKPLPTSNAKRDTSARVTPDLKPKSASQKTTPEKGYASKDPRLSDQKSKPVIPKLPANKVESTAKKPADPRKSSSESQKATPPEKGNVSKDPRFQDGKSKPVIPRLSANKVDSSAKKPADPTTSSSESRKGSSNNPAKKTSTVENKKPLEDKSSDQRSSTEKPSSDKVDILRGDKTSKPVVAAAPKPGLNRDVPPKQVSYAAEVSKSVVRSVSEKTVESEAVRKPTESAALVKKCDKPQGSSAKSMTGSEGHLRKESARPPTPEATGLNRSKQEGSSQGCQSPIVRKESSTKPPTPTLIRDKANKDSSSAGMDHLLQFVLLLVKIKTILGTGKCLCLVRTPV